MMENIIGATILILVIRVIRHLTKGKISMRLRYALWLMAVLRLVLPMSIGSSPLSVMNVQKAVKSYEARDIQEMPLGTVEGGGGQDVQEMRYTSGYGTEYIAGSGEHIDEPGTGILPDNAEDAGNLAAAEMPSGNNLSARKTENVSGWLFYAVIGIWIAGIMAVGGYMAAGQICFISRLHRTRKEVFLCDLPDIWKKRIAERGMHVYTVQGLPGPCMAGKSIYINPQLCGEKDRLLHVLAHEYAHAVQGDTLWAVVRCVLCAVYWFHPLVWLAAYEAKQDSELACDEKAIVMLGEAERFAYGRTLVGLLSGGHQRMSYSGAVLMMNDNAKKVKERVSVIAQKRKKSGIATGIVVLTMVLACGCAFTGAQQDGGDIAAEEQRQQEEAMRAVAEKMEQTESAEIMSRFAEVKDEAAQIQQEEAEMRIVAEGIEQTESAEIQDRFDAVEGEWQQTTAKEFGNLIDHIEDDVLETAIPADSLERLACYDYLYNGAECPIEDGTWCRLYQDEGYDIEIYGLYTEKYGCRGVKMKIDGDVNTWDMLWRLPVFERDIEVMMLEVTEEGLPRTFAINVRTENTRSSEVWRLYLVDRYDTGTVDLYVFEEENCRKQFRDRVGFSLNEEENMVLVTCEGDVAGAIDISDYAEYTVDEIIWDGSVMGYSLGEDNTINLKTCIGLRMAETGEVLYRGLSVINCPVDLGIWGGRKFTLGTLSVDTDWVNQALK